MLIRIMIRIVIRIIVCSSDELHQVAALNKVVPGLVPHHDAPCQFLFQVKAYLRLIDWVWGHRGLPPHDAECVSTQAPSELSVWAEPGGQPLPRPAPDLLERITADLLERITADLLERITADLLERITADTLLTNIRSKAQTHVYCPQWKCFSLPLSPVEAEP